MATIFAVGQDGGPVVAGLLFGACTDAAGLAIAWWVRRDRVSPVGAG